MSQLSYPTTIRPYINGQLAESSQKFAVTKVSEEASAGMAFGIMLMRGAGDDGALIPSLTDGALTAKLLGVLLHSHAYEPRTELNADGALVPKTDLSVLRRGRVAVPVEDACNPGDQLGVRLAAGAGGSILGYFRKAVVTGETTGLLPGVTVVEGTSAAGTAIVEIDVSQFEHVAAVKS